MGYVENNLTKNEVVVQKASKNALCLLGTWIFGILFCCLLLIPLIKAIAATVRFSKIELAITNKRVVGKVGVISTASLDVPLNKVQNVAVAYTFWGKIFNAGNIKISSAAGEMTFPFISNADAFKSAILAQADQFEEDRLAQQAQQMASAMASAIKN